MEDDWREVSALLTGKVDLEITGGHGEIKAKSVADCYFRNGSFYLLFQENIPEDGKEGRLIFSSRLKISRDRVSLKRNLVERGGKAAGHSMEMIYELREEGERGSLIDYPSPYGILKLEIQTRGMDIRVLEDQLIAEIDYLLIQEGQEAGTDRLKIKVGKSGKN